MRQLTVLRIKSTTFLILVCLFAFLLRLLVMGLGGTYRVVEDDTDHFGFGWEMGRVARSLVHGEGFSSPLPEPTGPTAIVGPVYPLLLALAFKAFGVYSTAASIAVHVMQILFASLTCLFIYLGGRDSVGELAGRLAAVFWSVFPLNIFFTVTKVWETSLTALLASVLFWYMLREYRSLSIIRWAGAGVLLGLAALTSTSLVVLIFPFGIGALIVNRMRALLPATVGALVCLAVVSPWLIRNHGIFGKYMLRSNFPLEFRVGNNDWTYGQKIEALHPSNVLAINRHWQETGELKFMAEESEANAQFVHAHPGKFAFSTINRIVNYWTGAWIKPISGYPNSWAVIIPTSLLSLAGLLGLWTMYRGGNLNVFMFAGCLLLYPIVYYITTSQPRFYHAMTPLLVISAALWGSDAWKRIATHRAGKNDVTDSSVVDLKEMA